VKCLLTFGVSRGMRSVSVCDVKFRFEHHQGAVKHKEPKSGTEKGTGCTGTGAIVVPGFSTHP